jgi:hypothetical protein
MLGIVLAVLAAGFALAFSLLAPNLFGGQGNPAARTSFGVLFFLSSGLAFKVAVVPAFIAIAATEGYRIRAPAFYAVFGGLVALLSHLFSGITSQLAPGPAGMAVPHEMAAVTLAGILGGLVYWGVAGRKAGAWRIPAAGG